MTTYDAIIIGAGHNGLTCACYLADAGLRVGVCERRAVVGGAAVTEAFHPGFRNSVLSYTVSLLHPKVIADLDLARHGLRVVERTLSNFMPLPDGRFLKLGGEREATQREIEKFSRADAAAYPRYGEALERIADVVRGELLETPPDPSARGLAGLAALLRGGRLARRMRRLDLDRQRDLLALFAGSAGDFLDRWFESDPIKALLGFDGVVGTYASPYASGTGYVLLHHVLGEVNGKRGAWGHAVGGMGAVTQAMARQAESLGVEIHLEAPVAELLVDRRVRGVRLEDGREVRARIVVSNLNPRLLFGELTPDQALKPDFRRRMDGWKCASGVFRINVALSERPDFACLPGAGDHLSAGIIMAPSLAYMDRAHVDARREGWSRQPIVEMLIPSTVDDTLAPPGRHVASLFCQQFAPQLPNARSWPDARDEAADHIIDFVDSYAPNFKQSIIARQALSPYDMEQRFGLVGGDIFHGALSPDQLYSARPMLGHADYRAPISGLYMCGAGAHPGGGVTGLPGHNAAREILKDWRRNP